MKEVHKIKVKNLIDSKAIMEKKEVYGIQDNYTYKDDELIEILKISKEDIIH